MNRYTIRSALTIFLLIPALFIDAQMDSFDIQGHRGFRGRFPENTLIAFEEAIKAGVTTIELDVVLSADKTWIVSHEPWLNHEICTDLQGREINPELENTFNLYWLTDDEIRACDCGGKGHPRFPEQQAIATFKPTLAEVIDLGERLGLDRGIPVRYNIEIKSQVDWYGVYQPEPEEYVDFFTHFMDGITCMDRITVQCFDLRILQLLHEQRPDWTLALLADNGLSVRQNVQLLGFTPDIYSPRYTYVHKLAVKACRELGMRLIPWTVNDPEDMKRLIHLGVDGIITDHPDRLMGMPR